MTTTVTPRKAAQMLDVSTQAVYRLIKRGTLTCEGESRDIPIEQIEARLSLPVIGEDNVQRRAAVTAIGRQTPEQIAASANGA